MSELKEVMTSIALTYASSGEDKIVSPLRKAMSELDCTLPNWFFDSEEGLKVHDAIQKVWSEIDKLEGIQ